MPNNPGCVFCQIVAGDAPAIVAREWPDAIAIVPRGGGCGYGHLLVIPRAHVDTARRDPLITGLVAARAAELAEDHEHFNLIVNNGTLATQTVFHLHWHYIPRREGDGLTLPWTGQVTT